jgi:hypothetical protein
MVFHLPHGKATVTAHAALNGHPLKRVSVRVTFHCAGERPSIHRGFTDARGNVRFTEGRRMPNAVRILNCSVAARATVAGRTARDTGVVHFIHPYWLKVASQAADGSHVVIAAFARPGAVLDVHVNGRFVARARTGKSGWVNVPLAGARPGDLVELAGIGDHEFSHAIVLGPTPSLALVH